MRVYINVYQNYRILTFQQILASTTGFIELLAPSSKQPVKDNRDVVSDWLPVSRMWREKDSSRTFTCYEPAMYPKILKAQSPDIASIIYGT